MAKNPSWTLASRPSRRASRAIFVELTQSPEPFPFVLPKSCPI